MKATQPAATRRETPPNASVTPGTLVDRVIRLGALFRTLSMQPTQAHHRDSSWRRRIAIGAAVFAPLVFAACGSSSASKSQPAGTPSASTKPAANAVQIKLIAFRPAKLSVAAGTTVTWTQMDPGVHTVTSGTVIQGGAGVSVKPDGTFDSRELPTGKKFTHTFAAPGTYTYFCQIHPATMRGEITVK